MKSILRCTVCGGTFPIQRRASRKRPKGHVKTMWCPWCKRVRQFREK